MNYYLFLGSIYRLCPGVEDKNPKKRKRRKDVKKLLPVADYIVQACKISFCVSFDMLAAGV